MLIWIKMPQKIKAIIGIMMFIGLFVAGLNMPEFLGTEGQIIILILACVFFGVLIVWWLK